MLLLIVWFVGVGLFALGSVCSLVLIAGFVLTLGGFEIAVWLLRWMV